MVEDEDDDAKNVVERESRVRRLFVFVRAVFTIETRASAVRYAFSESLTNALTNNASGFVSDDDDANDKKNNNKNKNERRSTDDERAIAFVDESSGDSLRNGVGLSAFLDLTGCSNVVDMTLTEEFSMKDVRSIRTGERVAPTAPLVFFIGTTLAESGEKIVRICGERPEASMVTVLVSTCKETQHAGAREVREAFDLCVKDVERLILEKIGGNGDGGTNNNNASGIGEGEEQQQKPAESKEEEDDWDEDWGDDDWEDKQKEKASAALENTILATVSQKVVIQFFPGTIVAPLGPSAFRFPTSSAVGEFGARLLWG